MDPERLGTLIDRHADALELYARQWSDAAEDVVQEAFVALSRQRVEPEYPAAWLFRTVRNRAINAGTAARRRRRHEARAALDSASWFEPAPAAPIDPDAPRRRSGTCRTPSARRSSPTSGAASASPRSPS